MEMHIEIPAFKKNKTVVHRFLKLYPKMAEKAIRQSGQLIVGHIKRNKLSGMRHEYIGMSGKKAKGFTSGGVLAVRTSRLRSSIRAVYKRIGGRGVDTVIIGSNVKRKGFNYGAYWETHGRVWLRSAFDDKLKTVFNLIRHAIKKATGKNLGV
jgi:hypothetical protein